MHVPLVPSSNAIAEAVRIYQHANKVFPQQNLNTFVVVIGIFYEKTSKIS